MSPRHRQSLRASSTPSIASQQVVKAFTSSVKPNILSVPGSVLLLAVVLVVPLLTFSAAFAVSNRITNGAIWEQKGYFLSAAIDLPPASNFGTYGLTISLVAFTGVAIVRHHVVDTRLAQLDRSVLDLARLESIHQVSLCAAVSATLGGLGVAAYQHGVDHKIHNFFAATFILAALLHFVFESRLECLAGLSSPLARYTRRCLVWVAGIMCATFLSHVCVEEVGSTPIGIGKLRAAKAEILTCLCFLVYLATYTRSFRETTLTLSVAYTPGIRVEDRGDPDHRDEQRQRREAIPQERGSSARVISTCDLKESRTNGSALQLRRCFSAPSPEALLQPVARSSGPV